MKGRMPLQAGMALLALAAWPYLVTGPLWLTLPSLLLPCLLALASPALAIGLLLASAPILDGAMALVRTGSAEKIAEAGLGSWIEPMAIGLMAGMMGRLLWRREPGAAAPPGFAFFMGVVGCSLLLALTRFWAAWQEHLPAFLGMAWRALPDASPLASEHFLRAGLLLMAGAAWFTLVRRNLDGSSQVRWVAGCWLTGSLVAGIYGTWAWAGGWHRHWPYSSSLLEDKNSYGSYLVLTLFMAWAMLAACRSRWPRILAVAALIMSAWMLLLAGSKIALIATVAMVAVTLAGHLRRGRILARLGTVLAGLVLALLIAWGSLLLGPGRIAVTLSEITSPGYLAGYVQEKRLPVWSAAGNAFLENPVLGLGPGLLYRHLGSYYPPGQSGWRPLQENAHNQFLQLAAEAGGMGLLAFLYLVGRALAPALRRGRGALTPPRLLAMGLIGYLATTLSGHPLLLSRQVFLFWGALGCLAALQSTAATAGPRGHRSVGPAGLLVLLLALPAALLLQPRAPACAAAGLARQPLHHDFAAGFYPGESDDLRQWRWMKSWGEIRLCNHGGMLKDARLVLEMASFAVPRTLRLSLPDAGPLFLEVPSGGEPFILPPMDIPAGASSIILQATPAAAMPANGDRRNLAIAFLADPRLLSSDPRDGTSIPATP